MRTMTKTAAIKTAQSACGSIIRRSSTDYICMVPYRDDKIDGPSTEMQASTYPQIRARRAVKVARIALYLMGKADLIEDAEYTAYQSGIGNAKRIVDVVISN